MKKILLSLVLFGLLNGEETPLTQEIPSLQETQSIQETQQSSAVQKIKEYEAQHKVARETVPVEESKFLIDTPIPKTAHYLPLLQTLLDIKPGTLPNPIGISLIGSYTVEKYKIKGFRGTMGRNIGSIIVGGLRQGVIDNKAQIVGAITSNQSLDQIATLITKQIPGYNKLPPFLQQSIQGAIKTTIKNNANQWIDEIINNQNVVNGLADQINQIVGAGQEKEWKLSEGTAEIKTGAVGVKTDIYLFPFMNLFFTTAYLNVDQKTNVGTATVPLDKPLTIGGQTLSSLSFPVGTISNQLDGWLAMGGTNLAIGYKGFFASCMVSGGYVQLDDLQNNIKGFVKKPFMYIAPRIGYSYQGIFTVHTGVQRIQLFGETSGNDLSKLTGGLVEGYKTEIEKFPVTFLAGAQFMFMRDLGISVEYVGSPDTNGVNAELAWRF